MIYFDHNATTPIVAEVRETMADAMDRFWANPSSSHIVGKEASQALHDARIVFASLLNVLPEEVYFTSGGTEADNLAVCGVLDSFDIASCSSLLSSIEHPAIRMAMEYMEQRGHPFTSVSVDTNGQTDIDSLKNSIDDRTKFVSIMFANNEIGTLQPVYEIGAMCRDHNLIFHSDVVQAFGKVPVDLKECNLDLASFSSHKIYGPKGCGALYKRKDVTIQPRTFGGGQELNIRTGTQNLPAILGFVKAAEIAYSVMAQERKTLLYLTEYFYSELKNNIKDILRNGHSENRLPGTLNVSFPGTTSIQIVDELNKEDIYVSGGSACSSGSSSPSHVLKAIGRRTVDAIAGVRFSLGRSNTKDDVNYVVNSIKKTVNHLRIQNS